MDSESVDDEDNELCGVNNDLHEAAAVSLEVDSRDTVMRVEMSDLWFSKRSRWMVEQGWWQRRSKYCEELKSRGVNWLHLAIQV